MNRPILVDTHAHLDLIHDMPVDEVVAESVSCGVQRIVTVGIDVDSSGKARDIASRFEQVYFSAGIHPHEASRYEVKSVLKLRSLASEAKCVAIGETGLDFYRRFSSPDQQQRLFLEHIYLAKELGLPLIIHSRESDHEVLRMLRQERVSNGVMHCFSGSMELLDSCLELGLYISFSANITYGKSETMVKAIRHVPLERLLLETDSPYLAPKGQRGRVNHPRNVVCVAKKIAEVKGAELREVSARTTQNARDLFGIS